MKKYYLLFVLALVVFSCGDDESGGPVSNDLVDLPADTGGTHQAQVLGSTTADYGYYVYLPGGYETNANEYPLLVFLHGKSERGDGTSDLAILQKAIKLGPPKMIENGSWNPTYPMIVITPQYHGTTGNANNWGAGDPQNLKGFIEFAIDKYRVNTSRIYLTGLSHGGNGVYDYLTKLNESESYIAAAAPVAAYGANSGYGNCDNTPIWVFVGDGDGTNFNTSSNFIENYNSQSPAPRVPARFSVFEGAGHNVWDRTYSGSGIGTASPDYDAFNQELYDWMFEYQREE